MMALGGRLGVPQTYPPEPSVEDWTEAPLRSTFPARTPVLRYSPVPAPEPMLRGCDAVVAVQRFASEPACPRAPWPFHNAAPNAAAGTELQVIVSNVTEAGFRADATFPHRLTDLLHTRFARLPDGPPVFVIPTELVSDNGPRLAAMVDRLAGGLAQGPEFRAWLGRRVRVCSAVVDPVTPGAPSRDAPAALDRGRGDAAALPAAPDPP